MPEIVALDESPLADDSSTLSEGFQCPTCERSFTSAPGLKRHATRTHGAAPSNVSSSKPAKKDRAEETLGRRWADFQIGCSLLVSMACATCGKVLAEDATTDGEAIAGFAAKRPKLKKQIESFLSSADFLMLAGALGHTAQRMAGHHSIGKRFGLGTGHAENSGHNPQERMMQFMASMPPEARHQLLDKALDAQQRMADTRNNAATTVPTGVPVGGTHGPVEGAEPQPSPAYSAEDREMMARINGGARDFEDADALV